MDKGSFLKRSLESIFSTVMGIALTIGIAALVDSHKDKVQAREMMFSVVKSAEDNIAGMENADSVRKVERDAAYALLLVNKTFGNLSRFSEDSLKTYFQRCCASSGVNTYNSRTDNYFYSAQMMHQFKNPEMYAYFATYVEYEKEANARLDSLHDEAMKLLRIADSRKLQKNITYRELLEGLIADGTLPDYCSFLMHLNFKTMASGYRQFFDNMLMEMGATQEEYVRFKQNNTLVEEDRVTNLTK